MNYSFSSKFFQILFLFKKLRWLAPSWPTLKKDKTEQVFPLKESSNVELCGGSPEALSLSLCECWSLSHVRPFAMPWMISARLLCPWDSPGENTGVGRHSLLQEIFLTQGWNPGLPYCRHILYHLSHQGSQKQC